MKRIVKPLQNERVGLRLLLEKDLPLTLEWRNQENIRKWFIHSDPIQKEQHISWFEHYFQLDNDFVFIIEQVSESFRPVGQVALYHVDWENKRAEFGRLMIGELTAQGKGLAKAATALILSFAFEDLNLQEVYLEVFSDNVPAKTIYQAVGFRTLSVKGNLTTMIKTRDY